MNQTWMRLLVCVAVLFQAGCSGLKNCSTSGLYNGGLLSVGWSHSCRATYDELTALEEVRIRFDDISVYSDSVAAEVTLTVEQGTAELTLFDGDGMPVVLTASAGQPATYSGTARLSTGPSVRFDLEPVDGTAHKVHYEVRFSG